MTSTLFLQVAASDQIMIKGFSRTEQENDANNNMN